MKRDETSVLLVDDRSENLLALEAVLEPLPCRLVSVTSGEAALKAMLQEDFAVVLLDVQMPGLDGFETAELIKRRERTRTIPIIFVTAISKERHHVFRGYEAGAVDYVFKPYDPEVLRSKVAVFLELEEKTRAAARSEAMLAAAFDSAPIGMARLDTDGRITAANRALASLLERGVADLRDRLFDALVSERLASADADRRAALMSGGLLRYEHETCLVNPAGNEIPCALSFALAQPRGLPASVIVQVQDLRDRLRAQAEREVLVREQAARAEAEAVSQRLAAVQRITDASLRAVAVVPLVEDLLTRIVDVLSVDAAAMVLPDDDSHVAYLSAAGVEAGIQHRRWDPDGEDEHPLGDSVTMVHQTPLGDPGSGTLYVGSLFPRRFSAGDEALLRVAAARAGQAINRVRMFEREHTIAQSLQRSLLPDHLPSLPGVNTAARYFAAGAGSQVGGDWYDLVLQSDGSLLAIIGDVAGRGVEAAAAMGQLRSAVRAYALDGHSPAAILDRLAVFQAGMRPRSMATVLLARVEPDRQEVTHARAGHPPALLVAPDGTPQWLWGPGGTLLGINAAITYREETVPYPVGSTLVLYTDGLVERRGEILDDGLERLAAAAASGPARIDSLADHLIEHTVLDDDAEDDVTVLVLRAVSVREAAGANGDEIAWTIAGGPEAPAVARAHVRDHLAQTLPRERLHDVSLAVTELVTNACAHGGATAAEPVHVRVREHDSAVRVAVRDPSLGASRPEVQPEDLTRPGGMGLRILEAVSDGWGVSEDAPTEVWFEISR